MTKHEFLNRFSSELNRRGVADAADIVEEYVQHFSFKQADGYSEEEIAAKLGDPAQLAAQFEQSAAEQNGRGKKAAVVTACAFWTSCLGLHLSRWWLSARYSPPPHWRLPLQASA